MPRVATSLAELRGQPSIYEDLHVEARRVLDRNPEPRNVRDVAVALESMGYTETQAADLGYPSVFDLSQAVFDLAYLYYVPREPDAPLPRNTWRTYVADYAAGSWYAVPWVLSLLVLFVGRVALWSSLETSPQVSAVVSLAFVVAAGLAGATSQILARKGSFYFLQGNLPLARWVVVRVLVYGSATAALTVALVYCAYVVPRYGLRLGNTFAEFALCIFAFLVSAAPLYMLRRYGTLAAATGIALGVTLLGAHFVAGVPAGVRHAQLLGLAVGSGAMVVLAVSLTTVRAGTVTGEDDPAPRQVKPPVLRVMLWFGTPYAVYGLAYFVLVLGPALVAGLAYGHRLGVHRYVYPPTVAGSMDLALLELIVLLGFVHASIERFGRRLRPLLAGQRLEHWTEARRVLGREWWTSVSVVAGASVLVAWVAPRILLVMLPPAVVDSVHSPGGTTVLQVAVIGYALVPVGMLCSQYLFFLGRPSGAVVGVIGGAAVAVGLSAALAIGGHLDQVAWGLVAGGAVFAGAAGVASCRALRAGEEAYYGSF